MYIFFLENKKVIAKNIYDVVPYFIFLIFFKRCSVIHLFFSKQVPFFLIVQVPYFFKNLLKYIYIYQG